MIIHYIEEENIFAVIVNKLFVQKKYSNVILKIASKLMVNKGLRCLKRVGGRKIKSAFMIYADFKSIFVLEDNGKQNRDKISKYQKQHNCSYDNQLVCVYDKFGKPFKSYLGKDAVYNFINSMIKESKYCTDMMKKHF